MQVFHAGTSLNAAGKVVATGGRVLGVTATGKTVAEAQSAAYKVLRHCACRHAVDFGHACTKSPL